MRYTFHTGRRLLFRSVLCHYSNRNYLVSPKFTVHPLPGGSFRFCGSQTRVRIPLEAVSAYGRLKVLGRRNRWDRSLVLIEGVRLWEVSVRGGPIVNALPHLYQLGAL